MKTIRLVLALAIAPALLLRAQDATSDAPPAPAADVTHLTTEQLDQLLGPIALYPDALIALILPASTVPADVVLAARYLKDSNNDLSQVESRAWDDSVKSLTHYPEVLTWMDQNLTWTKQLGQAFVDQPSEVMNSIQRLRGRAQAAGTLTNTAQQQVVADTNVIRIVPTQPDVIYVPYYDPQIVYVDRPSYYSYSQPFMSFGIGYGVGSWLAFDCDWHQRTIWVGDRHRRWDRHDWRRPLVPPPVVSRSFVANPIVHPWRPAPRPPRPYVDFARARVEAARTTPPLATGFARTNVAVTGPVVNRAVDRVDTPTRPNDATRRDYSPGARRFNPPLSTTQGPVPVTSPATVTPHVSPATTPAPLPRSDWQYGRRDRGGATYVPAPQSSVPTVQAAAPMPTRSPVVGPMPAQSYYQRSLPAAPPISGPTYMRSAPMPVAAPALPQAAPVYRAPAPAAYQPAPAVATAPAPAAAAAVAAPAGGGDARHNRARDQQN
jgi:hypothetical protein